MILTDNQIPESKYYTWKDIRPHNNIQSLWVVLNNNVYDLTNIINQETNWEYKKNLMQWAGKDISHFFKGNNQKYNWRLPGKENSTIMLPGFREFLPKV